MGTKTIVSRTGLRSGPLGIYLNDHLAGATGGVWLARRTAASHRRGPMGDELRRLADEIGSDRDALLEIMAHLDVPVRRYKIYMGRLAELAGRLKLNGRIARSSPLSGFTELEMLRLGVEGKGAAWAVLRRLADRDDRLDRARLDRLISRARRQSEVLEDFRVRVAMRVF
ncbi:MULTISPECIES: hypothetical protein [Thermomonosporaceae]|uniref:hypothetical protein n=1 Tax=Thermomonosporaceae TaxID=2012 RepID=UPI00255AA42E|nr:MULTISPECIES: hypothetical protein [Thermomonosporaceae]